MPAVRDVQVLVDQTLYTTTSDGIINAPSARGKISVSYVGYSVIPALQEVSFRYWSDGLTSPERTLDADGRGHLSLAVDLRYRVTVTVNGGAATAKPTLTATSPFGSTHFTDGSRRWVLAVRGELSGGAVVERSVTYAFDPPHGAPKSQRQQFTAGPEALWAVRAP